MKCSISTYYKILDAELCNVPEENVIPISRLEYEAYTDE